MNYQYINGSGLIVADTSVILTETENEYKSVFGDDLIVTPDTPQGVLISAETTARKAVVNNNAALANQINPNEAGGIFLDAIGGLTGIERDVAEFTIIPNVTVTGVAGTVISQGAIAKTAAGDQFKTQFAVTLGAGGTALVDFIALQSGAIPAAINALNSIVSGVLGWETVSNATAGILGKTTQSDIGFRAYRNNTLSFQNVSLAAAITSALYAVEGVRSLSFRENIANSTQVIDGITLVEHSIYACVDGGSDTDIAAALLENKSAGCNWNGGTTVNIIEPTSGQEYPVKFARPDPIGILIKVTTTNGNVANIHQAILDYAAGNIEGLEGFKVGSDVSPFEIAGAIVRLYPSYYISNVEISVVTPVAYQNAPIEIGLDEIAVTQLSYLTVVVAP